MEILKTIVVGKFIIKKQNKKKMILTTVIESLNRNLGPVVQSVVSLTGLLRVISLTVLAASLYSILIFFAEKM